MLVLRVVAGLPQPATATSWRPGQQTLAWRDSWPVKRTLKTRANDRRSLLAGEPVVGTPLLLSRWFFVP